MQPTPETGRLLISASIPEMIEVFLLPYARHMRAKGWRVDALANGATSSALCREHFDHTYDIDWSRNPLDLRNLVTLPKEIRELVQRNAYDVVHVHTPVAGFVVRFALRKLRDPKVVYTAHGFHFQKNGNRIRNSVFRTAERVAGRWTDELIVINNEDYEAAIHEYLVPAGHLHYMPGIGIDLNRFNFEPLTTEQIESRRSALGLPLEVPLVLMVAEFIPRKRHEDALNAFAAVWSGAHLLLVGKGPLEDDVRQQAASLGLSRRVHFLGYRDDIPELMAISQLLLLPSLQEGLPMSVMEAMSMGVPVIGTDIRGTQDLLAGGAGVLVPTNSPAALAHAMNALLADKAQRELLRTKARERVRQYALGPLLEAHEALYGRLLGSVQLERETQAVDAGAAVPKR